MYNLVSHIHGKEKGKQADEFFANVDAALKNEDDKGDIIWRSIITAKGGKELEIPPPPEPTPVKKAEPAAVKAPVERDLKKETMQSSAMIVGTSAGLMAMGAGLPAGTGHLLNTFSLSGAAGYQVVMGVAHALHTPLMSVTNAISFG